MKKLLYLFALAAAATACGGKGDNDHNPGSDGNAQKPYTIALSKAAIAIHYDQADTILISDAAAGVTYTFSSSDAVTATVDHAGVVRGGLVGEAVITVQASDGNGTAQCAVTVAPYSTLYKEPYYEYGASREEVMKHINPNDILSNDGKRMWIKGEPPVDSVRFFIHKEKLHNSTVILDFSADSIYNEVVLFLTERYGKYKARPELNFDEDRRGKNLNVKVYTGSRNDITYYPIDDYLPL